MDHYRIRAVESAAFIQSNIRCLPEIGLLMGTGLGDSAASLDIEAAFDYKDIPHFPVSTVTSHLGRLLFGRLRGRPLVAMQGRFHLYEGYSPLEVTFPIRVMQELGVKHLIITNAAGGLNPGFRQGDIMLISDHINLTGANPLTGPNVEHWGPRFPDMVDAYDPQLIRIAETAARNIGLGLQKGVYVCLNGPSLETPAEWRFLRTIGADAVGLSTVIEVIAAIHAGIKVLGLSVITNINDPKNPVVATMESVISAAGKAAPELSSIIDRVVETIDES